MEESPIKQTIEPAIKFVKLIKPSDKVAIVHGHDTDAISSAAIIYKLLKKLLKIEPELVISDLNFSVRENTVKKIKKIMPAHIILLDLSEIGINILTQLKQIGKVMIIDHHVPKGYVKITYVNPRIYNFQTYQPTTYLAYKIYEKFFNTKEITWIAGVGTLADFGINNCLDLFEKLNKELTENLEPKDEILLEKSLLGKLTKIIDSAREVKDIKGAMLALHTLINAENYKQILDKKAPHTKELFKYFDLVENEFQKVVNDFNKNKKQMKNLLVYQIKSKFNLKSSLATHLQQFFDDKILMIYQKSGNFYDISFRHGKKINIDLAWLAREAARDIPNSNGGGHPSSSGARIPVKYFNKFLKNLNTLIK